MMDALSSSETSVLTRSKRRNIPEDEILHIIRYFKIGKEQSGVKHISLKKSLKINFKEFNSFLQPKLAIIKCVKLSSSKETAVFTVIIVDINLLSVYYLLCVCSINEELLERKVAAPV
jgi:hypothetical protein